jgi:hypothetical protein
LGHKPKKSRPETAENGSAQPAWFQRTASWAWATKTNTHLGWFQLKSRTTVHFNPTPARAHQANKNETGHYPRNPSSFTHSPTRNRTRERERKWDGGDPTEHIDDGTARESARRWATVTRGPFPVDQNWWVPSHEGKRRWLEVFPEQLINGDEPSSGGPQQISSRSSASPLRRPRWVPDALRVRVKRLIQFCFLIFLLILIDSHPSNLILISCGQRTTLDIDVKKEDSCANNLK